MRAPYLKLAAAVLAAGVAAAPLAAQSQSYVDEVVVAPRYGPDGPRSLSQAVPVDDLDLTSRAGREIMRLRVHQTAGDLCRALKEDPDAWSPLTRSCREDAKRSARTQMRMAVDQAYARADAYAYLDADRVR